MNTTQTNRQNPNQQSPKTETKRKGTYRIKNKEA